MNLWRIENEQARLSLHPGQAQAWRSEKRFTFVVAGTQSGKTSFGPWWLWREVQRRGAGDYLAVTASFDLFKLKMLPELRTVFETILDMGRWWAGDKVMELRELRRTNGGSERGPFLAEKADDPMWGRIILRSAQSKGGLEAATAKAAWLDECGQDGFTLEDWEAVQRRLSLEQGPVLGTTTPYNLGWLKTEIYEPAMAGDGTIEIVNFPSTMNPAFPEAEYRRQKGKMQPWRFGMFYDGLFTRPAGMIYACWNDGYLVDPFPIPDEWLRAVGVDFGGANNAILWAAENPETGVWYIYGEWLGGGMTSSAYADKVREKVPEGSEMLAWGGAKSEEQQRRDWGWLVSEPPLAGNVEAQIDRGVELMESGKLRVFRMCRGFRDEVGSYKRKLDSMGEPMDEIEHKRRFHRMDAYRYLASGIIEATGPLAVMI